MCSGEAGWSVWPPTFSWTKTSKKLVAVPVAVNGGISSVPGVLLAVSSISPNDGFAGSRLAVIGPIELLPLKSNCVISVFTWSRPLPSVSRALPLGGIATCTVVGPLSVTDSVWPLGYCNSICATVLEKWSISTGGGLVGFGVWTSASILTPVGLPLASSNSIGWVNGLT